MFLYIIKRIGGAIVVLWAVITITFGLMHAIPGGPFTEEKKLPPAVLANIEERYHLNDPLLTQYGDYLKHAAVLDLGPSFKYPGQTVNEIIAESMPVSAQLGLISLLLALGTGVTAGLLAAWRKNTWMDYALMLKGIGALRPWFAGPAGGNVEGAGLRYPAGAGSGSPSYGLYHAPDPVQRPRCTVPGLYQDSPVPRYQYAEAPLPSRSSQRPASCSQLYRPSGGGTADGKLYRRIDFCHSRTGKNAG